LLDSANLAAPWRRERPRPYVARALGRIFIEAVAIEQKRAANLAGGQHAVANHFQRFGGSLTLNVHFHAIIDDGVIAPDDAGRIKFHGLAPLTLAMLTGRLAPRRGRISARARLAPAPRSAAAHRATWANKLTAASARNAISAERHLPGAVGVW
jgi:hypothetical protein